MSGKYVYKKKALFFAAAILDFIGYGIRRCINLVAPKIYSAADIKNILILKFDHAGDVLLSTPAIRALRNSFPQAYITLVVGPWSADVAKGNKDVNQILTYRACRHDRSSEKRINLRETFSLIKHLRKKRYDMALDLRGDLFAIIIAFLSGIRRRVGYGWEGGGFLLTDIVKTSTDKHQSEIMLDSLRAVGVDPPGNLFPEIGFSEDDKIAAGEILRAGGFNGQTSLVGFHIGAGYPSKLWDSSGYAELMNILSQKYNKQVLIVGGNDDKDIYDRIKGSLNFMPVNAIGKTTFSESAALIERCSLFIGNDSALVHMAAAVGVPTIVIFSAANDWNRWKPVGKNVFGISKKITCMNCEKKSCDTMDCMKAITVEEVLNKIAEVMRHI